LILEDDERGKKKPLMPNPVGRGFVKLYYETSPPIAELISEHEWLRTAVREGFVKPMVYIVRAWDALVGNR
jgi:hypothetical protein